MFSQTVEYALRAVALLSERSPDAVTTDEIATATKVPKPYLSKVLQQLSRAGIVKSQRGVHGGVRLLPDPRELTILEVVNVVDPIRRIQECPLELKSHGVRLCPLHRRLDNALASVEQAFAETTLHDILSEPSESRPLCDIAPSPGQVPPGS